MSRPGAPSPKRTRHPYPRISGAYALTVGLETGADLFEAHAHPGKGAGVGIGSRPFQEVHTEQNVGGNIVDDIVFEDVRK